MSSSGIQPTAAEIIFMVCEASGSSRADNSQGGSLLLALEFLFKDILTSGSVLFFYPRKVPFVFKLYRFYFNYPSPLKDEIFEYKHKLLYNIEQYRPHLILPMSYEEMRNTTMLCLSTQIITFNIINILLFKMSPSET